jgi:receptor expression-enhancing protein 5/6
MEYIAQYVEKLSQSFDEIPRLKEFAERFQIKTGHIALGAVALVFIFVVFGIGEVFLTNLLGIIYPAYMSFKAIETAEKEDDRQWLTYWVVYGGFTIVDTVTDVLLFWVPFYHPIKLLILIFLAWPETRGAEIVYNRFIKSLLKQHEATIDDGLGRVKSQVEEVKRDAAHKAAEQALHDD